MSHPSVKWIPGAPKKLKVGMVLKSGSKVELIGSYGAQNSIEGGAPHMMSGSPIESHGQIVDAYVLEWLGNDGIVKGVSR